MLKCKYYYKLHKHFSNYYISFLSLKMKHLGSEIVPNSYDVECATECDIEFEFVVDHLEFKSCADVVLQAKLRKGDILISVDGKTCYPIKNIKSCVSKLFLLKIPPNKMLKLKLLKAKNLKSNFDDRTISRLLSYQQLQSQQLSDRVKDFLLLSRKFLKKGFFDKALSCGESALRYYASINARPNSSLKFKCYVTISEAYSKLYTNKKSMEYWKRTWQELMLLDELNYHMSFHTVLKVSSSLIYVLRKLSKDWKSIDNILSYILKNYQSNLKCLAFVFITYSTIFCIRKIYNIAKEFAFHALHLRMNIYGVKHISIAYTLRILAHIQMCDHDYSIDTENLLSNSIDAVCNNDNNSVAKNRCLAAIYGSISDLYELRGCYHTAAEYRRKEIHLRSCEQQPSLYHKLEEAKRRLVLISRAC